jgi:hypothetical protein
MIGFFLLSLPIFGVIRGRNAVDLAVARAFSVSEGSSLCIPIARGIQAKTGAFAYTKGGRRADLAQG